MALIEKLEFFLGIHDDGQIEVRRTRIVSDDLDNSVIGERHHRQVLEPGQDISTLPQRIQRVADAVWTPQVIADYLAAKAARTEI